MACSWATVTRAVHWLRNRAATSAVDFLRPNPPPRAPLPPPPSFFPSLLPPQARQAVAGAGVGATAAADTTRDVASTCINVASRATAATADGAIHALIARLLANSAVVALAEAAIDWCCFYYFVRNSLVALLEALCARKGYKFGLIGSEVVEDRPPSLPVCRERSPVACVEPSIREVLDKSLRKCQTCCDHPRFTAYHGILTTIVLQQCD